MKEENKKPELGQELNEAKGEKIEPWLKRDELDLLDSVFVEENDIPRNRKGNYKLRHISFYTTNLKAITNICKQLDEYTINASISHQYTEVLKKMALINTSGDITKYGKMLLDILYKDNNAIINLFRCKNLKVEDIPEKIQFTIEFFLFLVVKRCLDNKEESEKYGIQYKNLAYEPIENLEYFMSNIVDTINEPTNECTDITDMFNFSNDNLFYVIQGINFTGYEIKKFLRLKNCDKNRFIDLYSRILIEVDKIEEKTLCKREIKYYKYAMYYKKLVQKDVRNRIKHTIFNYVLFNSISVQRSKVKIIENINFNKIIKYDFIKNKFKEYELIDIYNMVYYGKDNQYNQKVVSAFKINADVIENLEKNNEFTIDSETRFSQGINLGKTLIFLNVDGDRIIMGSLYEIVKLKLDGNNIKVTVIKKEKLNLCMESEIIRKVMRG